jgi:hypothetical protein
MSGKKYDDELEYKELLSEYERYIRMSPGAYEDFDEWLEIEYGPSKAKVLKPSVRRNKHGRTGDNE